MIDNIFEEFFESTFMYFLKPIKNLNIQLFDIKIPVNKGFDILISYSYDNKNWSDFRKQEKYSDSIIDNENELYVCIWFKRIISNDLSIPTQLYDKPATEDKYFGNYAQLKNVDGTLKYGKGALKNIRSQSIIIESIIYDSITVNKSDVEYKEVFQIVDEFPRWNFYDNQQCNIQRWLNQCNAIAEMYGHTCIYFKTESVNDIEKNPQSGIHGTHYQLQNNVIRNVVDIKKIHVVMPSNELPQDRTIYSDWDMPLQDDFMIHIVRQKFEQAFGLKTVPNEKDYLYLPITNKLYRVSTMQPKNGFMGVVGWYEVFLAKYEDDDCVTINKDLKQALSGIPEVTDVLDEINVEEQDFLWDELTDIVEDGVLSKEKVNQDTVEEQKVATQNYTNKLEDTTFYVSLKETEKLRELYDKRLQIVSVNPEDSLFPITMYDCSAIDKRTVALQYKLTDYSINNKFSNVINNGYKLIFNFAIIGRFNGEVFDIVSDNNVISSICIKNKQLILFDTATQTEAVSEYKFEQDVLYQITIDFDFELKQYAFKIFKLKNKQKSLEYQNIYNLTEILAFNNQKIKITYIQLFGGKFLVNDIIFYIDNRKFIEDNCLPLVNMYKF